MIIIVNVRTDCSVVIIPFFSINFTVFVSVSKIGKEFIQDLVPRHCSILKFRMHTYIIHSIQICFLYCPWTIFIKLQKRFINYRLTFVIQGSSNSNKEFCKINISISISIKESEQFVTFISWKLYSNLPKTYCKLFSINFPVSVIWIKLSESSTKPSDCFSPSLFELVSHFI